MNTTTKTHNTKTKICGYLLLGGLVASPLMIIGAWGRDVYLANKENNQRIASALETSLGLKSEDLSLEILAGKCPERNQFLHSIQLYQTDFVP